MHELAKELNTTSTDVLAMLTELGEFVKSASSVVEAPVANKLRQRCGRARPTTVAHAVPSGPSRSGLRDARRNDPYQDLGKTEIDHLQTADRPVRRYEDHRLNPFSPSRPRRPGDPLPPPAPMVVRPRRPRREWWRGAEPSAFTRYILDELILLRRDEGDPVPNPPWRYFEDEVKEALEISGKWSTCMLAGMDYDEILDWRETLDRFSARAWLLPARDGSPDHAIALRNAGVSPGDLGWRYGDETAGTLPERLARGQMTIDEVILEAKYRRGDAV